jgi:hypothetical protein
VRDRRTMVWRWSMALSTGGRRRRWLEATRWLSAGGGD